MHEQASTFIVCQLTAAILIRRSLYREYIRINSKYKLQKANTTGTRHWPLKRHSKLRRNSQKIAEMYNSVEELVQVFCLN